MLSTIKKIIPIEFKEVFKKGIYKIINPPSDDNFGRSYSQSGEDMILGYLFSTMGKAKISYLDIGANHPINGSNTYCFYERGSNGVCVEADPSLFKFLSETRVNDTCLNVGVTFDERKEADFYIFSLPALNTLSKEEAEFREKNGSFKVEKIIKIPLKTINEIIEENFEATPDFISIDVEGIDLDILKSLDFEKHRPTAICVETITYSENNTEQKITEILDFATSNGYFIYADTHINTIFVDEKTFRDSKSTVKI
jgi:FkbM family methyltransferase